MSACTATAAREGCWWLVDVVGVTQSRTLAEAHIWVQGLIEAVTGEADPVFTLARSCREPEDDSGTRLSRHTHPALSRAGFSRRPNCAEQLVRCARG